VRESATRSERLLTLNEPGAPTGYWVPRSNIILGRLVRGGGWAPDYQLRLLRRGRASYDESRTVHETVLLDGPAGYLTHGFIHYNYRSWSDFLVRQRGYTALEAQALREAGVRFRCRSLAGQPLREFAHRYLWLGGWKDGLLGLRLSLTMAYFAHKRVRLTGWEMSRAKRSANPQHS
jgi:hypothetical protein